LTRRTTSKCVQDGLSKKLHHEGSTTGKKICHGKGGRDERVHATQGTCEEEEEDPARWQAKADDEQGKRYRNDPKIVVIATNTRTTSKA
jgi:hypothetical protein